MKNLKSFAPFLASAALAGLVAGCVERRIVQVPVYYPAPPAYVQSTAPPGTNGVPPAAQPLPPGSMVATAPPAPQVEMQPPSPGPEYLWMPGYWVVQGGGWVWLNGGWGLGPRPGAIWMRPHWERRRHGYVWVGGYWRL